MGFGTDLQGRASHDALLHLQDTEIRLLETFKKCMTQRLIADKEYAAALGNVVNTATKLDIQQYDSPVFKAWDTIVKQTEALQKVMQQNTDRMCTKTLESLITLINDKRTTRKTYADERQRLEVEFAKLQEDVQKSKGEYERVMEKVSHDRAKYEDLHRKGKLTSKFEEARTKYNKSTGKLHRAHNDYILLLREVTNHQKHYLQNTLPSLLEYQETCLQNLVKQCQDVFRDYAELTDSSSSPHAQCHRCISNSIAAINYKEEYSDFLSKHKSDKLEASKFEFDRNIMDVYKGNLVADQVALDDTTFENLKHRQKTLQERLDGIKLKKDNKTKEMNEINVQLAQQAASEYNNDASAKAARNAKEKTWQVLNREVTELQCQESKTQVLLDVVSRSVNRVGDGEPPKAIELAEAPPPPEPDPNNPSQSNAVASPGAAAIGSLGKKLGGLKSTISNMKMPFNKQTSHTPPKPPSKDFLTSNHQPSTSEDNLNRPYEDETISRGATNNHVGEGPPERLEEQPYFHGVLPREEVQRLLINQGDYLVRESRNKKTGETQYVLSVMWNGYKHFIIQGGDGNWRFEGESRGTIPELIAVQHDSNQPVTNKSQVILKTAIVKETWELNNDDIETCEKIGNGNFGDVFRGIYKPDKLEVAVKTCRETLSEEAKKKFLQEGRILKQYDHPNIVKFVGIAATRQPVMIVMEYVPGGALLNFLKKRGQDQQTRQLVKMCLDAAAGMNYLETKNCIHRDLAARNCLVGKNNSVKISDFGMSREEEEYTVSDGLKQIPIKWTAPEALNFGKYTSLCDVWSFGILMWEVFSGGATPYQGLTNNQAREKIDTGYRLPSPEGTPEIVYKLMQSCWEYEADDRPHFDGIHAELEKIVKLF